MPKRKYSESQALAVVPLPIQTFLWRQTSPFIRPKIGKLIEASCVSFERVVVQNIVHGLSPSLSDAIESISRWKLIESAFPHLMHCCAALLQLRKQEGRTGRFGVCETKLLYTLHWIMLDAAEECEDVDAQAHRSNRPKEFLFSITSIQLFVYLFAPLLATMEPEDFNLRLESGLKLWQPLKEYRQPDIPCLTALIRPKKTVLYPDKKERVGGQFGGIFVGKRSPSEDFDFINFGGPPGVDADNADALSVRANSDAPSSLKAPLATMSEICGSTTYSEASSARVEIACEWCGTVITSRRGEYRTCKCGRTCTPRAQPSTTTRINNNSDHDLKLIVGGGDDDAGVDKGFIQDKLDSALKMQLTRSPSNQDVRGATYFDVAVLRCLFIPQWEEDGVFWALQYLHERLKEIRDETCRTQRTRQRSSSLPMPKITVSLYETPEASARDLNLDFQTEYSDHRSSFENIAGGNGGGGSGSGSGGAYKRVKVDTRASIVATASDSTSTTHSLPDDEVQFTMGGRLLKREREEMLALESNIYDPPSRPRSALAKLIENTMQSKGGDAGGGGDGGGGTRDEAERRKSLPSVSPDEESGRTRASTSSKIDKNSDQSVKKQSVVSTETHPIITITEHSPEPVVAAADDSCHSSVQGAAAAVAGGDEKLLSKSTASIQRSSTDSNIRYTVEELSEVAGTLHYTRKNGDIEYGVVLKAAHAVMMRETSLRVCEAVLNILDILLELGTPGKTPDELADDDKENDSGKGGVGRGRCEQPVDVGLKPAAPEELTAHNLCMDTVTRIFKALGCPYGCGEGYRCPPAELLRAQGLGTLSRLHRGDATQFRRFLRELVAKRPLSHLLDFFHAMFGFCADPNGALSPHGQKRATNSTNAMDGGAARGGYSTNFGCGLKGAAKGVEGTVLACVLKVLVTRLCESSAELKSMENMALYCDVRQLITYVTAAHGGLFRRVALSGLLDAVDRSRKKKKEPPKKEPVVAATGDDDDGPDSGPRSPAPSIGEETPRGKESRAKSRQSIFRKKVHKVLSNSSLTGDDSEGEGSAPAATVHGRAHRVLTPRMSFSEEDASYPNTPKRRVSKFQLVSWLKNAKAAGHMSLGFLRARKTLGFGQRKSKRGSFEEGPVRHSQSLRHVQQASSSLSMSGGGGGGGDAVSPLNMLMHYKNYGSDPGNKGLLAFDADAASTDALLREKRLVSVGAVNAGMLRFAFLLETCQPGSFPDPQLIAATLDLEAPVVARAALLLECAYFVHQCNRGNWPDWIKLHVPVSRPSGFPLQNRGQPSGFRRQTILKKAIGRMFYLWAEAIGARLEEILAAEDHSEATVAAAIHDEKERRANRIIDDEEDFLDDTTVNDGGGACPYALKMVACQLLLEVTAFLRETYVYLPRAHTHARRENLWEKSLNTRRCSSILSSMGQSQMSTHSISSLIDMAPVTVPTHSERRISFMVTGTGHDADADSVHSSNTTLMVPDDESPAAEAGRTRRVAQSRQKLLRRHHGGSASGGGANTSFRRQSLRLKKKKPDDKSDDTDDSFHHSSFRRNESIKSRKVSTAYSERSDNSNEDHSGEERPESPGVLSDETADSPAAAELVAQEQEEADYQYATKMPWLRIVTQLSHVTTFACPHQHSCHPDCHKRQMRSCTRLMHAIRKVYGDTFLAVDGDDKDASSTSVGAAARKEEVKREKSKERLHRKISMITPGSPTRRRESSLLTATIDRKNAEALAKKVQQVTQQHKESQQQQEQKEKLAAASKKRAEPREEPPILKYIKSQALELFHSPLSTYAKAAVVMTEEQFTDVMGIAWELLLESDQQLIAAAATVFIVSAVKTRERAVDIITQRLAHENPDERINAIFRFRLLWLSRYQCWPRMENDAHTVFKVPPPNIDFTMPSPAVGLASSNVVDPPWMPHFKTKIEEVALNQDGFGTARSFVTATKTRRKQQLERVHQALKAEDEKRRESRERFHLTTVPIALRAGYEPSLHQVAPEEHGDEGDEERVHHVQLAPSLFPSCLCAAILPIINLLEDREVNDDGVAVSEVAFKVIWSCLVEDPALFFRHFLEKMTNRERLPELIMLLHKLMTHVQELPGHAAHTLFNYMLGFIMFHVRAPVEGSQEAIAISLSLLWQIVPDVQDVFFKELKQTLKREQCDAMIMLTASVPSAKKIIVHGPDLTSIPSQFPIHEDTQFGQILQDSIDFFNVDDEHAGDYVLVDAKTHQLHNPTAYVRDFYFFRRSFYPELALLHMNAHEAFVNLQRQELVLKFVEIGKVHLTNAIIKSCPPGQLQNRVTLLYDELVKLPSFPRKALDTAFGLHHGEQGREMYALDMLHKHVWVQLIASVFDGVRGQLTAASELQLAVNVINGDLLLHCEDSSQLRLCIATLINAVRGFRTVFAANGYLLVMPTLLRIYGGHQTNTLLCHAIEWTCRQFYTLHRKPFLLQMFGSVASILDMDTASKLGDTNKVPAACFFSLLLAMEEPLVDPLDIMALVGGEKPLTVQDLCYENDDEDYSVVEAISLCVTVVAFAPESSRALEMLTVMKAIVPYYLEHLRARTARATKGGVAASARHELGVITAVAASIRAMIAACEMFTRNYTGPQRHYEKPNLNSVKVGGRGYSNHSPQSVELGGGGDDDRCEEMHIRFVDDRARRRYDEALEDLEPIAEFRSPRDAILCIVADFACVAGRRVKELPKLLADPSARVPDLLDVRSHTRLSEIAHTLLKLSPYDPLTMACQGLQKYIRQMLPFTDWSVEAIRPCLNMIFRRLDKTFTKIYKRAPLRKNCDWDAAASLLQGVYLSLQKYPYVAYLPHIKFLLNMCLSITLADSTGPGVGGSMHSIHHGSLQSCLQHAPPQGFNRAVVQLVCMQIHVTGEQYTLEQLCGGMATLSSLDKTENILLNLIIPVCLRSGSGGSESPRIRHADVIFSLSFTLDAILPPRSSSHGGGASNRSHRPSISDIGGGGDAHDRIPRIVRHTLYQIAFLCLKVIITCFERELASEWHRVARIVRELGARHGGDAHVWSFIDFVVSNRSTLFVMLKPFIEHRMLRAPATVADGDGEARRAIAEKLRGYRVPTRCRGTLLQELSRELYALRDELSTRSGGADFRSRTPTLVPAEQQSETSYGRQRLASLVGGIGIGGEAKERLAVRSDVSSTTSSGGGRLTRKASMHHRRLLHKQSSVASSKSASDLDSEDAVSREASLRSRRSSRGYVEIVDDQTSESQKSWPVGRADTVRHARHRLQRQAAQSRKTFRRPKKLIGGGESGLQQEETEEETLAETGTDADYELEARRRPQAAAPRRAGAMMKRDRSGVSPPGSPMVAPRADAYIAPAARCDSLESLHASENAALLHDDDRRCKPTSICMYFDSNDGRRGDRGRGEERRRTLLLTEPCATAVRTHAN
ncbi:PREDICTED: protein unc-80 homolog [Priapulus caudatus]|uniref:Protein unc-80 homolog n=1 Tax=Priapulus caudatus TaxID=37621 RepID=A0ABM1EI05_PRICU|nr:PREDICTED: protein unc-80 homolog [Priapulus caudatus]